LNLSPSTNQLRVTLQRLHFFANLLRRHAQALFVFPALKAEID
jgi:hypothetical protein